MNENQIIVDQIIKDEDPPYVTTSGIENEPITYAMCVNGCGGTNDNHTYSCPSNNDLWNDNTAENVALQSK